MRFPAKKNAGCPKAPRDFPPRKDGILYPRRVVLGLPSPSHRVCADGRTYGRTDGRSRDYYVTTKISRIDRLPYFLSNGAPLAGFARRLRYHLKISPLRATNDRNECFRFCFRSVLPFLSRYKWKVKIVKDCLL